MNFTIAELKELEIMFEKSSRIRKNLDYQGAELHKSIYDKIVQELGLKE